VLPFDLFQTVDPTTIDEFRRQRKRKKKKRLFIYSFPHLIYSRRLIPQPLMNSEDKEREKRKKDFLYIHFHFNTLVL